MLLPPEQLKASRALTLLMSSNLTEFPTRDLYLSTSLTSKMKTTTTPNSSDWVSRLLKQRGLHLGPASFLPSFLQELPWDPWVDLTFSPSSAEHVTGGLPVHSSSSQKRKALYASEDYYYTQIHSKRTHCPLTLLSVLTCAEPPLEHTQHFFKNTTFYQPSGNTPRQCSETCLTP